MNCYAYISWDGTQQTDERTNTLGVRTRLLGEELREQGNGSEAQSGNVGLRKAERTL